MICYKFVSKYDPMNVRTETKKIRGKKKSLRKEPVQGYLHEFLEIYKYKAQGLWNNEFSNEQT